jgi:PAS domain S-box-containing protein
MNLSASLGAGRASGLTVLCEDGERILCRGWRDDDDGGRTGVLVVHSASEHPTPGFVDRLGHEYELKDELDGQSAARPLALVREHGRAMLFLEDPGGEPLDRFLGSPMEMGKFLRFATGLSAALRQLHERRLIHKDIKPANVLVDSATGQVWLTGFGIASRLPRERQSPEPPELVAGTLAYMAPEQTGRMNRSIDSRSDLYSLGVTLYEMLTGALPFMASDPMEWVHCHIARQPVPPAERSKGVPLPVSAIVSKLLAKTAEDRYQTAAGLERDLQRCLAAWETRHRIPAFALGQQDTPDRLLIPEKLYGREREIETLLAAFDHVVTSGRPELVLVSGYSGIGKSAVVNELHKALVPRGLFASGKFDQYERDIPYATLVQAFQSLVRRLLGKSEVELQIWREHLQQALDPNGSLIIDLVPELKLIIGAQPPVPDLPPQDAKNRFQLVFRRFIGVFARPEHPLALFLDDLQWLDTATLDLLEQLITHSEVRHLLLIGAYRDNEVGPSRPLRRTLDAIDQAGVRFREIVLAPLGIDDLGRLVTDALHCKPERAQPLAQLVNEKTGGNPFFAIQFFTALGEEGLLAFDPVTRTWQWDTDRIRAKSYSDNVVDLMAGKLKRFPANTLEALKQLACLGNVAEIVTLTMVYGQTEDALHAALWEAVRAGLVFREGGSYKFLHDRIQQAAYSLVPDEHRADIHLRIGRMLMASMTEQQLSEHLFDVANQLNRGAGRLIDRDEKTQVATINLRAGQKAKASAAHVSASAYLSAGMTLLDESDWNSQHALMFSLWLGCAECEILNGNFEKAEQLIAELLRRAASKIAFADASCLKIYLHVLKGGEHPQAVDSALTCLRRFGMEMPAHPTFEQVQAEYEMVWQTLSGRRIEKMIDLPLMTDPELQAAMQVLSVLTPPAYFTDFHSFCLIACRMVNISMRHGISDPSTIGFALLGFISGPVFHRYGEGYLFAKLACDLAEKFGFVANQPKVYHAAGTVAFWTQPIATAIDFMRATFRVAIERGDLTFACYGLYQIITGLLLRNDPLDAAWRESEMALDFAREAKYGDAADIIVSQQRFIATMRGQTATFSTFSDAQFDEATFEAQLTGDRMPLIICFYWILKLKARFLSGDHTEALVAADKARPFLLATTAQIQLLDYFYYTALTVAACYENAAADGQAEWRALLAVHQEQLRDWAENYPPTFADRYALVSAEIARLEGRDADAMRLYEQAVQSARDNGFVQNEGTAHEVAARFYAVRGAGSIAHSCLRNARYCYLRWGADGKVRQLDRLHPHLAAAEWNSPTAATGSTVQQLDVASVAKASQAVSSEIVLSQLIERLMTIAIENAGADRGLLILPAKDDHLIQAEAKATGDRVEVALSQKLITGITCPESIVRYVIRTQESVIIGDTSRSNLFSEDGYLRDRQPRSILCLPLIKQGRLTGLLYLENTLTSHAFTPDRIAVLELLAAQAAISLENTRLYSDLQEREAKVRRLFDSNIIGIYIWDFQGRIIDANDAFLDMVGYSREDLISGRLHYPTLTPPEWNDVSERARAEVKTTGTAKVLEKEYLRKDGSRVPILLGGATFGEGQEQGVAFVLDLTERKEAEKNLRESERRYREAQAELAHVTRVTTLGELTASIAHEVNQPLAGVLANAEACLLWLDRETPDLDGVRRSVEWIIKDGNRAGEVIRRVRGLLKKSDTQKAPLDVNDIVNDAVAFVQGELRNHKVALRLDLASGLPAVRVDRVQLQQVIINFVINGIEAMQTITDRPSELSIRTHQDEAHQVMVTVKDCGVGISPADADRLFNAFFTTKSNGMGMGLSICRSIIEAHGGHAWAEPNLPHGAAFHFTVPLHHEDAL